MARKDDIITTFIPIPLESQQSAAFRLFKKKYMIRVAKIHTESAEYIAHRGVEGNEYQGQGRANAEQLITAMVSVDAMVSMFSEGATIRLVNASDAMTIYNDIVEHMQNWSRYLQTKIHGRFVPEEDLRLFDMFAAQVYPYARHDIKTAGSDLLLAGVAIRPTSRLRRGGISRFTAEEREAREAMERGNQHVPDQHSPMVEALMNVPTPTGKRKTKWT